MSSFKALTHKFKYKSSVMLFLISSDNRIFHPPLLTWPGILSLVAKNIGYIHLLVTTQWEDKSYPSTYCFLPSVERACLENRDAQKYQIKNSVLIIIIQYAIIRRYKPPNLIYTFLPVIYHESCCLDSTVTCMCFFLI